MSKIMLKLFANIYKCFFFGGFMKNLISFSQNLFHLKDVLFYVVIYSFILISFESTDTYKDNNCCYIYLNLTFNISYTVKPFFILENKRKKNT